jgi:hypothetical protein
VLFLDEWDIRPGDFIIRKIFDEGQAKSDFFFIVLAKTSVEARAIIQSQMSGPATPSPEGSPYRVDGL